MAVDRAKMVAQLVLHEGLRVQAYTDTLGNWTIGIGYNITARGYDFFEQIVGHRVAPVDGLHEHARCTEAEAHAVCTADIGRFERAVLVHFPEYVTLNEVRQRVVLDLAFNIAFKALGFKRCIAAIKIKDWSTAARELHKSHWAKQVEASVDLDADASEILNKKIRGRADRLARMLLTGKD